MSDVVRTRSARLEHLDQVECWALLADSPLGRVASVGPEGLELLPVNHAVDGHRVVVRTEADGWLAETADGREVLFEVDGFDDHSAWSVVVRSTARLLEASGDVERAATLGIEAWAPIEDDAFVELTPHAVTGRRIARHTRSAPWYW